MSIEVLNESGEAEVNEQMLIDVASFAMRSMDVHPDAEATITLVDEATMADLHVRWMDLEGPTDVMSFPMDELTPGGGRPDADMPGPAMLGDIILCPAYDRKQAEMAGHDLAHEMALLTVHGVLHLLGYDHVEPADERELTSDEDDLAGADEAVDELHEVVDFLTDPTVYEKLGAKIPRGVLLYGPPGTGKTLLARAVAGEAGVPFYSISGSDFVEMFVGVGASRVRDLFKQARENSPCIIFVDEIDAVGRQRGSGMGGGHDEREQTLNQLLVEMDGFTGREGVILIAATNRPDILDPALLRPGRFDRQIPVTNPDLAGRAQILKVHAKNKPLADDVSLDALAKRTAGMSGADLANVLNEAALLTARIGGNVITADALEEATDRVIGGPRRSSKVISEHEKKVTAYHEGGHTLAAWALKDIERVYKVTILARGRTGGFAMTADEDDKGMYTRDELFARMVFAMGGRSAEELVFGAPTTGASNDIEQATKISRAMVTEYGMTSSLGPVKYGQEQGDPFAGMGGGGTRADGVRAAPPYTLCTSAGGTLLLPRKKPAMVRRAAPGGGGDAACALAD